MARPIKDGLDYFPLDVTNDDKLDLIEAEFGVVGWSIIIKLYRRIYKNGYYTRWTEDELLLFGKQINVDNNLINAVINKSIERNLFNEEMFNKYKILTSNGIQKRYLEATHRRKGLSLVKEYCLPVVDEYINRVNVNINFQNVDKSTQSKVKYSRVEESKESLSSKIPFGIFWSAYDKKVGSKDKLERKWDKLSKETQVKIIAHIPIYKKAQPEKQYRKDPSTYLNNQSWEDEIINRNKPLSKTEQNLKGLMEATV
jgi:uncharacterized protein DUF4373